MPFFEKEKKKIKTTALMRQERVSLPHNFETFTVMFSALIIESTCPIRAGVTEWSVSYSYGVQSIRTWAVRRITSHAKQLGQEAKRVHVRSFKRYIAKTVRSVLLTN